MEFKEILTILASRLEQVTYQNGDLSDIGNEIGIQLGSILPGMTEEEVQDFIHGFKHGISLTNNTH
mgnify:FL=1